ncbi:hypothetical protein BRADI_1g17805v3 [Brachypodium distachyon]|uniref:Uncharacterized protein n=1 Tax=Brachypodium distachyon TaxID=15368 RepID=A0A2K2DJX2_BRADI|nr:hypothetical protein BRADI_1g17805v3 [Brachypodium distachyon]
MYCMSHLSHIYCMQAFRSCRLDRAFGRAFGRLACSKGQGGEACSIKISVPVLFGIHAKS